MNFYDKNIAVFMSNYFTTIIINSNMLQKMNGVYDRSYLSSFHKINQTINYFKSFSLCLRPKCFIMWLYSSLLRSVKVAMLQRRYLDSVEVCLDWIDIATPMARLLHLLHIFLICSVLIYFIHKKLGSYLEMLQEAEYHIILMKPCNCSI